MALERQYANAVREAVRRFKKGDRNTPIAYFNGVMEVSLTDRSVSVIIPKKSFMQTDIRNLVRELAIKDSISLSPGIVKDTTLLRFVPA